MGDVAGLHWGSNGWIGFVATNERWRFDFYPTIEGAWDHLSDVEFLLVTVPIGLPSVETGRRTCDEAAKSLLGPRHQRVFYAPVREAVYETSLRAAKERNDAAGFGIQNQAWLRAPRIREVDEFLARRPAARERIAETNPAVCFQALADRRLEHGRETNEGFEERIALLREVAPTVIETVEDAIEALTLPRYAPLVTAHADVLDAAVTAVTARRHPDLATLPMSPETDDRGLEMAIVYPGDTRQLTLGDLDSHG